MEWGASEKIRLQHFEFVTPGNPYLVEKCDAGYPTVSIEMGKPMRWHPSYWKLSKTYLIKKFIENAVRS